MTSPEKKLIYVLNSYSASDASHFPHVFNLLDALAKDGCKIALIIEKAKFLPVALHDGVSVRKLRCGFPAIRHIELFVRIVVLILKGYRKSFIRISAPAAIIVATANRIIGGESYFWQSGTTHEQDWAQKRSLKKLRWYLLSYLPSWSARKLVNYFVTGPESMVEYYERVVGIKRQKIRLLYNDVDIKRFSNNALTSGRMAVRARCNVESGVTMLLLVHRLSPVRRTISYLEFLLPRLLERDLEGRWRLVIAGGGDEFRGVAALVAKLGLADRCCLLGDVPNLLIPELYAAADIFIHPTYTEGFPRALIEAMAAGLPIVSTDAGGVRELLGDAQLEYVVDKAAPHLFADKVLQLMHEENTWSRLGTENRIEVGRFSTPEVAKMYMRTIFDG